MGNDFNIDLPFRPAQIYAAKDGEGNLITKRPNGKPAHWYIYFMYRNPQTHRFEMFKRAMGINRIHNVRQRMIKARLIQKVINSNLLSGDLNPFGRYQESRTVNECVEKYLTEHVSNLRPRTRSSIKSAMKLLREKFGKAHVPEITGSELKSHLVSLSTKRKWENKTYNGTLVYWKAFFNYFRKQDPPLIEKNPCDSIQYLKVYPTDFTRPPTQTEFERIVNCLYGQDKSLFLFAMFIYYMGYRVSETGFLKRSSFEFQTENPYIRLAAKDQKDNEETIQFISPHLLPFLYEMGIDKLPPEYFLFSTNILPGAKPIKKIKDRVEFRWKMIVKQQLGIHVNLYSMKHKQATELGENTTDKEISLFLRHSNEETTRHYMRNKRAQVPITFFQNQRPLPLKKDSDPVKVVKIK